MATNDEPFIKNQQADTYTAIRELTDNDIIEKARDVLGKQFERGQRLATPNQTEQYLKLALAAFEQEVFACLFLDNRHRIIAFEKLFFGTIDYATVHPREIAKRALAYNAAAVILSHNHPSGLTEPSSADERITRRIVKTLALIDVRVLDHVIVGDEPSTSFAKLGLL